MTIPSYELTAIHNPSARTAGSARGFNGHRNLRVDHLAMLNSSQECGTRYLRPSLTHRVSP